MAVETISFGCRLNIAETEGMRRAALAAGMSDAVLVNSCAVTAEAVRQARQAIRRAKRERPDRPVIVSGCAAQVDPEMFARMAEVDRVVGNAVKADAVAYAGDARVSVPDFQTRPPEPAVERIEGLTRGFVEIQNGCDHRCTFCIIPFARGPSRSVPVETVIARARRFVEAGVREIVLTGVDVTSYAASDGAGLGRLIKALLASLPDLQRLRLTSVDTVEIDRDLLDIIGNEERFLPHMHLSLQSGDDLILKRMKRRHSRADAVRLCAELDRLRPGIALTADLIAGFPTETETHFARSLDLVEECGLVNVHVFPYSARPGTPAARMPPLPGPVIAERARRLREVAAEALRRRLDHEIGQVRYVLVERGGTGHTEHNLSVAVPEEAERGAIVPLRLTAHDGRALRGVPA